MSDEKVFERVSDVESSPTTAGYQSVTLDREVAYGGLPGRDQMHVRDVSEFLETTFDHAFRYGGDLEKSLRHYADELDKKGMITGHTTKNFRALADMVRDAPTLAGKREILEKSVRPYVRQIKMTRG